MLLREHRYPDIHADVSDVCAGVCGCGGVRACECMSVCFLRLNYVWQHLLEHRQHCE